MKLYTEEQVKQIFENLSTSTGYDYYMETYCDSLTPIELPSDEEIEKFTDTMFYGEKKYFAKVGAIWMKNEILNQK